MKSEMNWVFDSTLLRLAYGPFKQEDYHYKMLEKWGARYNAFYIKHMLIDKETGQYREL